MSTQPLIDHWKGLAIVLIRNGTSVKELMKVLCDADDEAGK